MMKDCSNKKGRCNLSETRQRIGERKGEKRGSVRDGLGTVTLGFVWTQGLKSARKKHTVLQLRRTEAPETLNVSRFVNSNSGT